MSKTGWDGQQVMMPVDSGSAVKLLILLVQSRLRHGSVTYPIALPCLKTVIKTRMMSMTNASVFK